MDWREEDSGDGIGPTLQLIVRVRPHKRLAHRCGICGEKRPRYDNGQGRRRWRALDLGTARTPLEAEAPRVSCPAHGVITAAVPWARHAEGLPARDGLQSVHCGMASSRPGRQAGGIAASCRMRSCRLRSASVIQPPRQAQAKPSISPLGSAASR